MNPAMKRFQELVTRCSQMSSENDIIDEVNHFFNQFNYVSDSINWRNKDYWSTLDEFIGLNRGDCEDYASAKFFTLLGLGVNPENLYMSYVKAIRFNEAHMVCLYYPKEEQTVDVVIPDVGVVESSDHQYEVGVPIVLDNINKTLRPLTERPDLRFVYAFNEKEIFIMGKGGKKGTGSSRVDRLTKWTELMDKHKQTQAYEIITKINKDPLNDSEEY